MDKPIVLVLDNGNSARSQMAEAFIRKFGAQKFQVYSAGTQPKGINPLTVTVMQESGIDMSGQFSKGVQDYLGVLPVGYLITLTQSAEQHAPSSWPNIMERFDWPTEDPTVFEGTEEEKLAKFRSVRDEIEAKVKAWLRV